MTDAAATTLWARALLDEIARCGVRDVVVAPGSRSTPLVLAAAATGRFRMRVHLDERSAAFFALGVGKATGRAAAVITTSGTATANLYPAVVEAAQSGVPLLLLTADRPPRLRGADANQAIDQIRMFGDYPRAFFETAAPELDGRAVRHLRMLACRAVAAAQGPPAGPVHVNVPLDKPLEPVEDAPEAAAFSASDPVAAAGREDGRPFVEIHRGATVAVEDAARVRAALVESMRPVLVAGPLPDARDAGPALVELAAAVGVPLLADPLSGARFSPGAAEECVAGYDLFLRDAELRERLKPDLILRVGASPTSAALQRYLFHHASVRQIVVDEGGRWKDHGATAWTYILAPPAALVREVVRGWEGAASSKAGPTSWVRRWRAASLASREALAAADSNQDAGSPDTDTAALGPGAREMEAVAALVAAAPPGTRLLVSNSMPIRDVDAAALPRDESLVVMGNRGASGVDGVVSTAFGMAAGAQAPTLCVLGDVAFFHDQNGLLWSREEDAPVVVVLVDNDGGGIFHMLPVREHEPEFTRFFATPHGLDFVHTAHQYGVELRDVFPQDLSAAAREALAGRKTVILRLRTGREESLRRREHITASVIRSVKDALGA